MHTLVRPVADEHDALLAYLAEQRQAVRDAAHGLTDEQVRLAPLPGRWTLGGLIARACHTERYWVDVIFRRAGVPDGEEVPAPPAEPLGRLLEEYHDIARDTEVALAPVSDFGERVPVPHGFPDVPAGVEAWTVRWVLLRLIAETARIAGRAEMVRAAIDAAGADRELPASRRTARRW